MPVLREDVGTSRFESHWRSLTDLASHRNTLRTGPMTVVGQTRSFGDVGSMSDLPESGHGRAIHETTPSNLLPWLGGPHFGLAARAMRTSESTTPTTAGCRRDSSRRRSAPARTASRARARRPAA